MLNSAWNGAVEGLAAEGAARHPVKRCAVFVPPHMGGIYSFYRSLSEILGERVFSVELEGEHETWRDYAPTLAGREHRVLPLGGAAGVAASRAIVQWVQAERIDTVLLFPLTPSAVHDALPHLPANVRVLVRLTEISPHSYELALRRSDSLDGIIVQCPRQIDDTAALLPGVKRYLIPNGVDVGRFKPRSSRLGEGEPVRLLVLDRLVHLQKRVLLLPRLCAELDALGQPFRLTVVGDGPDAAALRQALTPWLNKGNVEMTGFLEPWRVPDLMADQDIYLKLSRNEGSPNSILEAAAAGVATVASSIPGVIDYVIDDGKTGVIVPPNDMPGMAAAIVRLAQAPVERERLGAAARERAVAEFSLSRMQERYVALFDNLPLASRQQYPWHEWAESRPERGPLWRTVRGLIPLSLRVRMREIFRGARSILTADT